MRLHLKATLPLFLCAGTKCTVQDAFQVLPVNTQGAIGQNVTLNCELSDPSDSLYWRNPDVFIVYERHLESSMVLKGSMR